ncbi:MAG: hypothetical protein IJP77_09385 [Bacteroidales bacterium]|nr:hypothetical protein [Bacteroidales bacterium]
MPETPVTMCRNDGTPLSAADFAGVKNYVVLHGSWGMPVAHNFEGDESLLQRHLRRRSWTT